MEKQAMISTIAKKMFEQNLDIVLISKVTGLSKEELEKIYKDYQYELREKELQQIAKYLGDGFIVRSTPYDRYIPDSERTHRR